MLSKAIARFWAFDLSPPVCAGPAKIVKGESKDKRENLFFEFGHAEPHPIFYKDSERRVQRQMKTMFSNLAMSSRILSSTKIRNLWLISLFHRVVGGMAG